MHNERRPVSSELLYDEVCLTLNSTERKSYNFYIPTGEDQNVKDRGGYPKGTGEMKEKERRV